MPRFRPPPAAVRDALRLIPGVVAVNDLPSSDGIGRYMVESSRGRDVRGEVFLLAAQKRWDLRELRRMGMTLEEVFLRRGSVGRRRQPAISLSGCGGGRDGRRHDRGVAEAN